MTLATDQLVLALFGGVVGSFFTSIIFAIIVALKKKRIAKQDTFKYQIMGQIGKKCSEIDNSYSEYRMGKITMDSLESKILERVEKVNTELGMNSELLDQYYIRNIERFLQDQKNFLMGSNTGEIDNRSIVRPAEPVQNLAVQEKELDTVPKDAVEKIVKPEVEQIKELDPEPEINIPEEAEEFVLEESVPEVAKVEEPIIESAAAPALAKQEEMPFDQNATMVLNSDSLFPSSNSSPDISVKESAPVVPAQIPEFNLDPKPLVSQPVVTEMPIPEPRKQQAKPPKPVTPVTPELLDLEATQVFDLEALEKGKAVAPAITKQSSPAPVAPLLDSQPNNGLMAFDVEATQEFNLSDVVQSSTISESPIDTGITIGGAPSAPQPKQKKEDLMVSGDDVADQMDNFFGFE